MWLWPLGYLSSSSINEKKKDMGKGKARTAIDRPTNVALAKHKDEPTLCNRAVWCDENGKELYQQEIELIEGEGSEGYGA